MEEKKEKKVTSAMVTTWYPDLQWNVTRPGKEKDKENKPIPENIPDVERVAVEIEWPNQEDFELLTANRPSTNALFFALTRACAKKIIRFSFKEEPIESGAELLAIRTPGAHRVRELAINIGSYIFRESVITEEEEKN